MKIQVQRLLSAIIVFMVTVGAYADEVDGINYDLNSENKTASVAYYDYSGDIVIPSQIEVDGVTYSVTSIGDNAFTDCRSLISVSIPNSVTSIGICAFGYCRSLTSVSIPNSVTYIEDSAFAGCEGLTSVTIPATVTIIGYGAFSGCSGLTSITMEAIVPPTTAADALDWVPTSCVIRVPAGSREAYAAAAPWNKFTIEEYGSETGIGITPDTGLSIIGYYDMEGRRLSAPVKGTCIVHYSDGTTRKVIIK